MRELIAVAAMKMNARWKTALQAREEILVAFLAAAERDQNELARLQQRWQRLAQQVEAFLSRHSRHDSDQRRARSARQMQSLQKFLLQLGFHAKQIGAIVARQ